MATYFDPHDPKDIKMKLEAVLTNPTPPEREMVRKQLDQFTWKNIYAKFLEDIKK